MYHAARAQDFVAAGHLSGGGAGALSLFGEDFRKAGFHWTRELCEMDSDGDGAFAFAFACASFVPLPSLVWVRVARAGSRSAAPGVRSESWRCATRSVPRR